MSSNSFADNAARLAVLVDGNSGQDNNAQREVKPQDTREGDRNDLPCEKREVKQKDLREVQPSDSRNMTLFQRLEATADEELKNILATLPVATLSRLSAACQEAHVIARENSIHDILGMMVAEGLNVADLIGKARVGGEFQAVLMGAKAELALSEAADVTIAEYAEQGKGSKQKGKRRGLQLNNKRMTPKIRNHILKMVRANKDNSEICQDVKNKFDFIVPSSSLCNLRRVAHLEN